VNLFFFSSRGTVGRPVTHRKGRGWRGGFLGTAIEQYIKLDLNKWLRVLRHLELLPRPLGQDWSEIWLQKFSGTITIWPKSVPSDFYHILSDPSPERLARMIHMGQQSAFPKIQFIKNRLIIEYAIMRGLQQCSTTGRRSVSPILSRRLHNSENEDVMERRLDESLPERGDSSYKHESPYVDFSDSMSQSTVSGPSRPQTPTSRRSSVMEEIQRQTAVFFDDSDLYGDEDAVVT
jgi:hypothetical protein